MTTTTTTNSLSWMIFFFFLLLSTTTAFVVVDLHQHCSCRHDADAAVSRTGALNMGYVPDGMTPEQYRKLKAKEKQEQSNKKFGAFGPQSFKSRSLQSFQKDLESGKTGHLMPMFNAADKLKKGQIKQKDIPYMQRMGSWDDSDLGKNNKKKWTADDKRYNPNPRQTGPDWTGRSNTPQRGGPNSKAAAGRANQQQQQKKKKNPFSLF